MRWTAHLHSVSKSRDAQHRIVYEAELLEVSTAVMRAEMLVKAAGRAAGAVFMSRRLQAPILFNV